MKQKTGRIPKQLSVPSCTSLMAAFPTLSPRAQIRLDVLGSWSESLYKLSSIHMLDARLISPPSSPRDE